MLNKYINNKYLKDKNLKLEFYKNKPFPHLVLNNFFNIKFIEKVAKELRKEKFIHQESDLFSFAQTKDISLTKNKIIKEFYGFINSREFKEYLYKITGIKAYNKIDASGFIYSSTDYLLPHDDKLETRKIAYVLNLSKGFTKKDGGSLDFFKKNQISKSITPSFNTLTIFKVKVNKTFHQVSEVITKKERFSIAGWFNDK